MAQKIKMDGLYEEMDEQERNSKAKSNTHEEKPKSKNEMDRKPTDLNPVNKINSLEFKEEAKSKKVLLLMKPSLYAKVKELAEKKGTSVNNAINVMLESLLEAQKG